MRRRWKWETFTDIWRARLKDDGQKGIRNVHLSFQLRWAKTHFVYHHPSLWKQLTRHCCNSLQWWWQMNCSWHHWQHHLRQDAPFEVSACMIIKYWESIKIGVQFDGCKITQLQLISNRNKGFDCLDVLNGFVRFCKKFQRMWFSHNLTQSYIHENYNATYKTLLYFQPVIMTDKHRSASFGMSPQFEVLFCLSIQLLVRSERKSEYNIKYM